jgi:hypothetical protein
MAALISANIMHQVTTRIGFIFGETAAHRGGGEPSGSRVCCGFRNGLSAA